jgi:hypothetical protein
MEDVRKTFLVNRDETGREIVRYLETGKEYFIEYTEPRNFRSSWGDIDPASKTIQGSYGDKFRGAIKAEDSLITKENGFDNIIEGKGGSPYHAINQMHEIWKKENGYV